MARPIGLAVLALLAPISVGAQCLTTNLYDAANGDGQCAGLIASGYACAEYFASGTPYAGYCDAECAYNVYDSAAGAGNCDGFMSMCETDLAPGGQYEGYCDFACGYCGAEPEAEPAAAAGPVQVGIVFQHCPPGAGMVGTEAECQAAAAAVGVPYAGQAGTEWASGCLYHAGSVYYSPYEEGTTENPTDAFMCTTAGPALTFQHCLPGEGMIETEAECIDAAATVGAPYASAAGTEWASGCLFHGGSIYYSTHDDSSTQDPTDAYICNPFEAAGAPAAEPAADCTTVTVSVHTATYATENTWQIDGGDLVGGYDYANNMHYTHEVCLADGEHTLTYYDSWSDGWHGGTIGVEGYVDTIAVTGSGGTATFTVGECTDDDAQAAALFDVAGLTCQGVSDSSACGTLANAGYPATCCASCTTAPAAEPACAEGECCCSGVTSSSGTGGADCGSYYQGLPHCYTEPGACADGQPSAQIDGVEWSFVACEAYCTDDDAQAAALFGVAGLTCQGVVDGSACGTLADAGYPHTCCASCASVPPPPPSACTGQVSVGDGDSIVMPPPGTSMSNNQECTWVASCAGSLAPQITFSAFDIESGWDFVYVDTDSDGSPDGAPLSGGYGGGVPDPITASANSMSILYDSDYAVNGAGFEATVSCVDPAALPP